jgi:hypothetical protein
LLGAFALLGLACAGATGATSFNVTGAFARITFFDFFVIALSCVCTKTLNDEIASGQMMKWIGLTEIAVDIFHQLRTVKN